MSEATEDLSEVKEEDVNFLGLDHVFQEDRKWFLNEYAATQRTCIANISAQAKKFIADHFLVPLSKGEHNPSVEVFRQHFSPMLQQHIQNILGKDVQLKVSSSYRLELNGIQVSFVPRENK